MTVFSARRAAKRRRLEAQVRPHFTLDTLAVITLR